MFKVHITQIENFVSSAKNLPDDVCHGDPTDGCTDAESLDCDVSSCYSNSQTEEPGNTSAHEAVFVPLNKPGKRKSMDVNLFHRSTRMSTLGYWGRQLRILVRSRPENCMRALGVHKPRELDSP